MKKVNWELEANRILKSEMARKGISYNQLSELLAVIGINETEDSLESKIRRGTFRAGFFLQCLNVLNCKSLNVEIEIPKSKKKN